jgi:GxxExxY protein
MFMRNLDQIHSIHIGQVISYLRASESRVGLLMNFNVPAFKQGIRGIVL